MNHSVHLFIVTASFLAVLRTLGTLWGSIRRCTYGGFFIGWKRHMKTVISSTTPTTTPTTAPITEWSLPSSPPLIGMSVAVTSQQSYSRIRTNQGKPELSSCWDGWLFGHDRHGQKSGGLLCLFPWEGAASPSNTMWRELRPIPQYQMESWSIQPFGHNTPTLQTDRTTIP